MKKSGSRTENYTMETKVSAVQSISRVTEDRAKFCRVFWGPE